MSEEREVSTWYLELRSPSQLLPARTPPWEHRFEQVKRPTAAFARYLYTHVGGDWHWTDRLSWSKARWDAHLVRDAVELHTLQIGGAPAGYVELERQAEGSVLIAYLGLIDTTTRMGFGGALTTYAARRAWGFAGTERVWVHTCSLDSPRALPSYQARGFSVYRTETKTLKLPPSPGPWAGWNSEQPT